MSEPDQSRSLQEIEDDYWGDPPAGATRLVSTAYAFRKQPIGALGVEGLRLLRHRFTLRPERGPATAR